MLEKPAKIPVAPETPKAHKECLNCHVSNKTPSAHDLTSGHDALCLGCHNERASKGEHRVGMLAPNSDNPLPLLKGKISCITCHEPHGRTFELSLLRAPAETLCTLCHDK